MPLDFPASPTIGQVYETWQWDGTKWVGGGAGGPFLPLSGGQMSGPITSTGDMAILPAYNGHYVLGANVNWPGPGPNLYASNSNIGGTVASGQQPIVESHNLGDTVNATSAQGGGLTWTRYAGNLNAGATGGRTCFGADFYQTGATISPAGQYYVAGAFWAQASYSAGGSAGSLMGNMFASNDAVLLNTGAGIYWNAITGYELDIAAASGTGVAYKQGMKVVTWITDAVAGSGGADFAYSVCAQGPGGSQPGWDVAYGIGSPDGVWPMKPGGTIMKGIPTGLGGPAYTVANGIDFTGINFTGRPFSSTNFAVDQYGDIGCNQIQISAQSGGPTWTSGAAAPSSTQPVGSLYSRVGGAVGATLYVSRGGGTWAAVAGV